VPAVEGGGRGEAKPASFRRARGLSTRDRPLGRGRPHRGRRGAHRHAPRRSEPAGVVGRGTQPGRGRGLGAARADPGGSPSEPPAAQPVAQRGPRRRARRRDEPAGPALFGHRDLQPHAVRDPRARQARASRRFGTPSAGLGARVVSRGLERGHWPSPVRARARRVPQDADDRARGEPVRGRSSSYNARGWRTAT
jgi:hypothetical protein